MKLIYKTALPVVAMIVIIMAGIAYFSRASLEHALIVQDFDRIKTVVQNALELEIGDHHDEGGEEPFDESIPHEEEAEEGARTQIIEAEDFLAPSSAGAQAQFNRYIEEFKDPIVVEINIFDRDGNIVASSRKVKIGREIGFEGMRVFERGEFYSLAEQNAGNILLTYVPFTFDSNTVGAVEVRSELAHILTPLREEMNILTIFLVLIGIAAILTFYLIERWFILKPIYYLRDEAEKIGLGKLDSPIKLDSKDELGAVADHFENMRQNIKSSFEKLSHFNEELEKKVKEKTEELRAEQAKLMASMESLVFGFVIIDMEKNVILSNSATGKILGSGGQKVGFPLLENYFGTAFNIAGSYAEVLEKKESIVSENIDTHQKFLKIRLSPITSKNSVLGVICVIEDDTEEVLLQRRKDEFFAVASHELRTPLTSIRGNMALIKDYYAEKIQIPEVITMVSQAHKSAIQLLDIVNDFLDASKLEQGKGVGEFSKVDLSKVLDDVSADLAILAKNKGVSLVVEPSETLPLVLGDELRLKEVAYNLMGNGLNYTEKGEVRVKAMVEDDQVKVLVSDTGVGITPQNQKLLFNKFQQAGTSVLSRAISTSSTGMGLYISKLLVEAMHGKIGLVSSSASGSTFFFSIPIAK